MNSPSLAQPIPIAAARQKRDGWSGPVATSQDTRPLPASAEIEAAFLFLLTSEGRVSDVTAEAFRLIEPRHLFNPTNQAAYEVAKDLAAAGLLFDVVTLCDKLQAVPPPMGGWKRYLTETIPADGAHASAPPSQYAEILLEKWRLRETIRVCDETSAKARNSAESAAIGDEARAAMVAIAETRSTANQAPAATTYDVVRDVWRDIEAATAHGKPLGTSWGFPVLDSTIGRLQQPGYIVVGGRSGQGKTQIAWQTGLNIGTQPADPATGMREGMYYASFEMARKSLLSRGICIEANVPPKMVQAAKIPRERNPRLDGAECPTCAAEYRFDTWDALPTNSRNEKVCRLCAARERSVEAAPCPMALPSPFERLVAASDLISGTPIFIDDKPCPPRELAERFKRVRDLAAEGKMLTRDGKPYPRCEVKSIVIDSIQDEPPPPGPSNRNRTTEIQDTSKAILNEIAKGCNVTVIGLAKLTREIDKQKDRRPQLKDIRECGDIEYHADEIFFVHREQYYLRERTPPELRNIAEIVHGKGRSGLDLEAPPPKLWFAGGMFFDAPPMGWQAWEEKHGVRGG